MIYLKIAEITKSMTTVVPLICLYFRAWSIDSYDHQVDFLKIALNDSNFFLFERKRCLVLQVMI